MKILTEWLMKVGKWYKLEKTFSKPLAKPAIQYYELLNIILEKNSYSMIPE